VAALVAADLPGFCSGCLACAGRPGWRGSHDPIDQLHRRRLAQHPDRDPVRHAMRKATHTMIHKAAGYRPSTVLTERYWP
jgi:hypothetical protein